MKKVYLILMMLLVASFAKAQDTIVLLDGKEVVCKIEKVTDGELEYRMWDNVDGPLRVKKISAVFMVKYKNGQHEVFKEGRQSNNHSSMLIGKTSCLTLKRSGGKIVSEGNDKLSLNELECLLGEDLFQKYYSAKRGYDGGNLMLVLGWGMAPLGIAAIIDASSRPDYASSQLELVGGYVLCCLADIFIPVGYIVRGVNAGKISRVAEEYNSLNRNTFSMDVSVSPSLMVTSYGVVPGIGVGLRF